MIPWANLKRQYESIKDEILSGVVDVLESGNYILGDNLALFEKELARYHSADYAVGVANGTDAIQLALIAVGVKAGDEVITVPNTAVPTICAIRSAGARPVFVDINEDYYTIDVSKIEKAISSRTKAILPVHLYGQACDMDAIMEIAKKHDLKVVEDCAQAIGTMHKGKYGSRMVGTIGDIGCLSFYPTKNLGAYGDAGAIVTKDKDLYDRMRMLRNYGESSKYMNKIDGYNSRLDELQAKVLLIKLKRLDGWIAKRQAIAKDYIRILGKPGKPKSKSTMSIEMPKTAPYSSHTYHLFVVRVENRDDFRKRLDAKGIGTSIHYPMPVHFQEAYKHLGYKQGDFPVAEHHCARIVSLPMFPELTDDEVREVCSKIKEALA